MVLTIDIFLTFEYAMETYFSIFGGRHIDTLSQGLNNRHGVVFLVFIAVGGAAAAVAVTVLVFSDCRVVVDVSVGLVVAIVVIARGSGHNFVEIESFQVEGWKISSLLFDTLLAKEKVSQCSPILSAISA